MTILKFPDGARKAALLVRGVGFEPTKYAPSERHLGFLTKLVTTN
jgi:hypothetical protein